MLLCAQVLVTFIEKNLFQYRIDSRTKPCSMKAIIIDHFGGPEALEIREVNEPKAERGYTTVKVKAFGLNQAEMHMRQGYWDEWNPISGLECVGTVSACPDGHLAVGTKVIGLMGGMGRSIPGSYAEYCNVPNPNAIPIETCLSWEESAAIPETHSCAWSCVFGMLNVQRGETLLIRGATSAFGQAAINLAVNAGAKVTATTRRRQRFPMLEASGVSIVEVEEPELVQKYQDQHFRFDKVLNLVGNIVLLDTLTIVRRGGWLCQAGWLGGLAPIKEFNPMLEMASGVHFILYHGKELGTEQFPVAEIPFQDIVRNIEQHKYSKNAAHIFDFNNIIEAHTMLDSFDAGGKIVVRMP